MSKKCCSNVLNYSQDQTPLKWTKKMPICVCFMLFCIPWFLWNVTAVLKWQYTLKMPPHQWLQWISSQNISSLFEPEEKKVKLYLCALSFCPPGPISKRESWMFSKYLQSRRTLQWLNVPWTLDSLRCKIAIIQHIMHHWVWYFAMMCYFVKNLEATYILKAKTVLESLIPFYHFTFLFICWKNFRGRGSCSAGGRNKPATAGWYMLAPNC